MKERPREITVLSTCPLPEVRARLERIGPPFRVEQRPPATRAEIDALDDPDLEVLIAPYPPRDLRRTPRLRWLQLSRAGVEHLFADDPWAPGLTVTNARGVYAVPIGQYVLAEILRINERVDARRALQESRRWPTDDEADLLVGRQLRGQVIVVVGYGGVGREVARLAAALGMRVIAVKSRPGQRAEDGFRVPGTGDPSGSIPERIVGLEALTEVVQLADVVVLTAPLTDRTRGLFDRQLIGALRPDAWFINVGRGAIVDEPALVEALRERRIGGAVLDVFVEEPLSPESPFWTLPNTLVTPHVSGADAAAGELVADLFEENLRRYAAGELLLNVVDPARQY